MFALFFAAPSSSRMICRETALLRRNEAEGMLASTGMR